MSKAPLSAVPVWARSSALRHVIVPPGAVTTDVGENARSAMVIVAAEAGDAAPDGGAVPLPPPSLGAGSRSDATTVTAPWYAVFERSRSST